MKNNILVLKTSEISNEIWQQICHGYEVCFQLKYTPSELKETFSNTITGYTLHAMKLNDSGEVIGHNYFQPRPYILNGRKVIVALSGGTYVLPEYRKDAFIFYDLFQVLSKYGKELGWLCHMGVPNENSFKYSVKILKHKYIGDLKYYILPLHIDKILKRMGALSIASYILCLIWSYIAYVISILLNFHERIKPFHLDNTQSYRDIRLSSNVYQTVTHGNITGTYRMYDEAGIQTAYILDFRQGEIRTCKSLAYVILHIIKHTSADAILYVGTMNMPQYSLFKVPNKYVPQKLPLCASVFDKENPYLTDVFSSLNNIDFSLIDFDVR